MDRWTMGLALGIAIAGAGSGLAGPSGSGPSAGGPPLRAPSDVWAIGSSGQTPLTADTVIHSSRWPPAGVAIDSSFRYLGFRTIDLGGAEAEIHVLVDTSDEGELERFYWIQFEGRKLESPGRYDYSGLPGRDTIDGFTFHTDVRHGAYTEAEVRGEADTGTVGAILVEHGLDFPAPMMRIRMVTLDARRRAELLVIYMEALEWSGLSLEDLQSDDDAWTRAAAALSQRAAGGLRLLPHSPTDSDTGRESAVTGPRR